MVRKGFWEITITELINIYGCRGGNPSRIVLNNFTYQLIMEELSRQKPWQENHKNIFGLNVFIDNSYRNLKKIEIEIDDGH